MPDQSVLLEMVRRHFEYAGADVDRAHELYHDDAVLEFPQSGERFEGVTNFTEWRRKYPAEVRFRVRRITAREDLVVAEVSISYNGGPWHYAVQLMEFREDKVAREGSTSWRAGRPPSGEPPGARPFLQTRRSEALTIAGTAIRLRSARQSPSRRPGAGTNSQLDQRSGGAGRG